MYNQQRVFGKRTPLRVVGNRPFLSTLQKIHHRISIFKKMLVDINNITLKSETSNGSY